MNVKVERINLINRIGELLESKFGESVIFPYAVVAVKEKDDDYYQTIEIINYLMSLGEDGQTYLWNNFWYCFNRNDPDYGNDGIIFIFV